MHEALLSIFFIVSISLIALIILQQGQGVNMGTSFGTDVYGTLFSSSAFDNFMTRTIIILAILFFAISLMLSNININLYTEKSKWANLFKQKESNQTQIITKPNPNNDIPQ